MKAIIFCAGLGTRLRPFTNSKPKAMVTLNRKPLLAHQIIKLEKLGVTEIVINVHHYADMVIDYVQTIEWGIPIHISDERNLLLDTGGGLKKMEAFFKNEEAFLVHNVDIFSDIDINELLAFHNKNDALITMAVRKRTSSRYLLFDGSQQLSGWENKKTEEKIITRANQALEAFAFSGIHIASPKVFNFLPEVGEPYSIVPPYLKISETEKVIGFEHSNDLWMDVGTPEKLKEAEAIF